VADFSRRGREGLGSESGTGGFSFSFSFSREVLLRRYEVSERLSFGLSVSDLRDLGRSFSATRRFPSVTVRELRFLRSFSFSLSFSLGA